jgi:hypothetical protein
MFEKSLHEESLARIENRIVELKRKISGLQERLYMLEASNLNTETTYSLLVTLIDHLDVMELRRRITLQDISAGQFIGKTGCREEY